MKVLIIDSYNMLHRARYGFGRGDHKGYFNFFRMLNSEIKRHSPDIVYVVDEGHPTQSVDLQPDYKANRKKLDDPQFDREITEVFETIKKTSGFVYIQHPDFECDDVVKRVATDFHKNDDVTIVSMDTDFIQLISGNVKLWNPRKKSFADPWYCDYLTWKALRGDPTDNVPGVPGVGGKTADKLTVSPTLMNEYLDAKPGRREAFDTSYAVIKLKDVPDERMHVEQSDFDATQLFTEFSNREFKSIIGKAWAGWEQRFSESGGKYVAR